MSKLGRCIFGLLTLAGGYVTYTLATVWWKIWNTSYHDLTPLEHTLGGWSFWFAIVAAALTFFAFLEAISD